MATHTLGTSAANSLTAVTYLSGGLLAADLAAIANGILDDLVNIHPIVGGFESTGLITIPNRGILQLRPGDVVAIDATTGWPIVLSAYAKTSGPWSYT